MLRCLMGNSWILVSCALIGTANISLQFLRNTSVNNSSSLFSSVVAAAKSIREEQKSKTIRILSRQVKQSDYRKQNNIQLTPNSWKGYGERTTYTDTVTVPIKCAKVHQKSIQNL